MVVLGDVHNTLEQTDYMQIAALSPDMQCYAQLGDWVDREQFYYKQLLMHQLAGTPFDSLPVLACPGNHEYTKGLNRQLPDSWFDSFAMPQNGPKDGLGTTYYVDFRNLRFIAIDTEDSQYLHDFTRLNTWVKNDQPKNTNSRTFRISSNIVLLLWFGKRERNVSLFSSQYGILLCFLPFLDRDYLRSS